MEWLWRAVRLALVAASGTTLIEAGVPTEYAVPASVVAGLILKVAGAKLGNKYTPKALQR